ncbi:uncharacterized protein B0H64DRAFT_416984 [Chaetomium fimeti]|uniref:Uncharacterized protein n=1 Tax=Chaetomium fimeti TaxID=1854472 RepID=A0AAE0LSH3_9PEZI|nr:hypothetical protein B0H64DRAFT_416984 [Chaetomium fimeti]
MASLVTVADPVASATILPQLSNVTITSISAQGTGCPEGTMSTAFSSDRTTITFGFDDFDTYIGPGMSPASKSKTCNITLTLSHPLGYSFEILDVVYHGFARLDAESNGIIVSSYTITGNEEGNGVFQTRSNIAGEPVGVYTRTNAIPEQSRLASRCGAGETGLQMETRATVSSGSSSNSGGWDDEPPFSLTVQQIHLGWSACKE